MGDDEAANAATDVAVCTACGVPVPESERAVGPEGQILCANCVGDTLPLVELQLDRDFPEVEDAGYECTVCRRRLPTEQVYESDGQIICTECWDQAHLATSEAGATVPAATDPPPRPRPAARPPLVARITCPRCWHPFAPQEVLWVSRHAELIGDTVAGPGASLRFLPSRFTADGSALDARGMACHTLACPRCHLIIPRPVLENAALLVSIAGVRDSGKSNFLTAMTWQLRRVLPELFDVSFDDVDPFFNRPLNENEATLFLAPDSERLVKLGKTDLAGSLLYDEIRLGQEVVILPRPFLFTLRPIGQHPNAPIAAHVTRVVGLYDNAGEHFSPGEDTAGVPTTGHLGHSKVLMFLYDPTQDGRFRACCRGHSGDPTLDEQAPARVQESVLLETAARIRHYSGIPAGQSIKRPMLVVVSKADMWGKLVDLDISTEPILSRAIRDTFAGVDLGRIEAISAVVRELLVEVAPEFVAAAEESWAQVVYVPTSALGSSPEAVPGREGFWVRPSQVMPQWVTVPFLYMFARWSRDVIGGVRSVAPVAAADARGVDWGEGVRDEEHGE